MNKKTCLTAGDIIRLLTEQIDTGKITAEHKLIIYGAGGRCAIAGLLHEPDRVTYQGGGNLIMGFAE